MTIEERLSELEQWTRKEEDHVRERLRLLEEAARSDYETAKDIIFSGAQLHAAVLRMEARLKEIELKLEKI